MGRRSQIKSLGYPDEMTKRNRYIKKKDKDFMQQLKKSLKEKKSSTDLIGWGFFSKTGGTLMDSQKFIDLCKSVLLILLTVNWITQIKKISESDIYVVWLAKTLQNNKALLSTNLFDGMYYEVTFNGDKMNYISMLIKVEKYQV